LTQATHLLLRNRERAQGLLSQGGQLLAARDHPAARLPVIGRHNPQPDLDARRRLRCDRAELNLLGQLDAPPATALARRNDASNGRLMDPVIELVTAGAETETLS
jgi:hypothetical protein